MRNTILLAFLEIIKNKLIRCYGNHVVDTQKSLVNGLEMGQNENVPGAYCLTNVVGDWGQVYGHVF